MGRETSDRVVLRDVARAAGVSLSTVSLALRNDSRLPPSTRKKVQRAAQELGYRPNPKLAQLMTTVRGSQSQILISLGLVTPHVDPRRREASPILLGAKERAAQLGYTFEEFPLAGGIGSEARLNEILRARNVDGVIVYSFHNSHARLDLDWDSLAAVAMGYTLTSPSLHRIAFDHFSGISLAFRELRKRGYRRIATCLSTRANDSVRRAWELGHLLQATGRNKGRSFAPLISASLDFPAFEKWFMPRRPDAILADGYGTQILEWLSKMGIGVPDEVGYVDLNQKEQRPEISGIDQNEYVMGSTAVDMLANEIYLNMRGIPKWPRTITIQGRWVQAKTTREVAPADSG